MTAASPEREKRHWGFPELEIPEAPLHPEERHLDLSNLKIHEAPPYHGGVPLVPPHRGGDLLGLSTREGPEVALHLPKCLNHYYHRLQKHQVALHLFHPLLGLQFQSSEGGLVITRPTGSRLK